VGEDENGKEKGGRTDYPVNYPVNGRNQGVKSVIRNSRATALDIRECRYMLRKDREGTDLAGI
jgi:hypothetical protein